MTLKQLGAELFRLIGELAFLSPQWFEPHTACRVESPAHDALRTAARRLGLDHARGRVWGELKMFVSAGLVEGFGSRLSRCQIPTPAGARAGASWYEEVAPGLEHKAVPRSSQSRGGRQTASVRPRAGHRATTARAPRIIRSLQALVVEGILTIDDERVELMLESWDISSRTVVIALREASSLAYELRRQRSEFPRSEHEIRVRDAWIQQASARGGHFDTRNEVLTFDSVAGEVRMSVEREDDSRLHGWRTNILLTFKRPLTLVTQRVAPALNHLETLTNQVELDPRHLRTFVTHAIHDPDELTKILEALVSAGAALDHEAESGRAAYR